ncbi:MAG: VTT domain-containing protein [Patescibacteria group bacterium]|mgnify:CR=1 FL=1
MYKRYIGIFLIIAVSALIFWYSLSLQQYFLVIILWLENYIRERQFLGVLIFIGLAAISSMLSPFSSVPLVPAAAMLWGNIFASLLLIAGWLVGHTLTYAIGRYTGYPIAKRLIPFAKIEEYRKHFSSRSEFILVLLFRLSMPAEIPGYVLGIIRYNFGKYFLATLISELPFGFLVVYGSEALIMKKTIIFFVLTASGIATMSAMFYLFTKKIKSRR